MQSSAKHVLNNLDLMISMNSNKQIDNLKVKII